MKISRTENTVRNMTWGYIYRVIAIVLPFVLRTVIIRYLGADYSGISSLFTSILQVLNLSELGFGTAVVYSMYKPIAENDVPRICALLKYFRKTYKIIGIIILFAGLVLLPFIRAFIYDTYPPGINIYIVYLLFLFNTVISYFLFAYRRSLINAFQRNDLESKILIMVSVFRYGTEIIGILLCRNYYLFLTLEIISTVALNFVCQLFTKKYFPEYTCYGGLNIGDKNEIKKNVVALMCHKIGGTVLNSADNIVLSSFMGVVIVSNYGNYYYLMSAIESLIIVIFAGMTAGIGNSFVVESPEKNKEYFNKILFFNAWIVILCCSCFVTLYQDFIELWVGKQYLFNNLIMFLFVIYFFIHSIRRTIITFRDGAGMWQDNKWQPLVSAGVNLIVNIILVHIIGVAGILISSIASMAFVDIPWEAKSFCKKIELANQEYLTQLIKYFFIMVLTCGFVYIICSYVNFGLIPNFLIKISISVILTNLFLFLLYHKTSEFIYFKALLTKYAYGITRKFIKQC